jgi:hypothetical protein
LTDTNHTLYIVPQGLEKDLFDSLVMCSFCHFLLRFKFLYIRDKFILELFKNLSF